MPKRSGNRTQARPPTTGSTDLLRCNNCGGLVLYAELEDHNCLSFSRVGAVQLRDGPGVLTVRA